MLMAAARGGLTSPNQRDVSFYHERRIRCRENYAERVSATAFHPLCGTSLHQLRGAFVTIGAAVSAAEGAGESEKVNHTFQPAGRLALSNSP